MSDRTLRLMMAAIGLVTIGIASYLLYAHYTGGAVVCSTDGCETVEQSPYAEILGVPVSLVGLLGSTAIVLSLLRGDDVGRAAGLAVAVCGLVFAAYLVFVQLAVLEAVCEWCIANDALIAVLAGLATWRAWPDLKGARPRATPGG